MSGVKEVCDCGHDKATHFERKLTCLGVACDCTEYRDPGVKPAHVTPLVPAPDSERRPHIDSSCRCPGCTAFDNRFRRWPW